MARGISLYVEGQSPLHRSHPLTKATLTLVIIALAFIAPSLPWVLALGLIVLLLLASAGVLARFGLEIPWGASLLAGFSPGTWIRGLEAVPAPVRPPAHPLTARRPPALSP